MHTELDQPHEQQHGLRPRQYVMIGILLTVITVVELAVSYADISLGVMIPVLLILSAIKFAIVVAFFMHLRYEAGILTRLFSGSFVLAAAVLIALMGLFWGSVSRIF
jgi:cytochrome c oxidase subunit 4